MVSLPYWTLHDQLLGQISSYLHCGQRKVAACELIDFLSLLHFLDSFVCLMQQTSGSVLKQVLTGVNAAKITDAEMEQYLEARAHQQALEAILGQCVDLSACFAYLVHDMKMRWASRTSLNFWLGTPPNTSKSFYAALVSSECRTHIWARKRYVTESSSYLHC